MGDELYCNRGESVGRLGVDINFEGVVVAEGVLVEVDVDVDVDMALAAGRLP